MDEVKQETPKQPEWKKVVEQTHDEIGLLQNKLTSVLEDDKDAPNQVKEEYGTELLVALNNLKGRLVDLNNRINL